MRLASYLDIQLGGISGIELRRKLSPRHHALSLFACAWPEGARETLLANDADAETVMRVAMRFGFCELGRLRWIIEQRLGRAPRKHCAARRRLGHLRHSVRKILIRPTSVEICIVRPTARPRSYSAFRPEGYIGGAHESDHARGGRVRCSAYSRRTDYRADGCHSGRRGRELLDTWLLREPGGDTPAARLHVGIHLLSHVGFGRRRRCFCAPGLARRKSLRTSVAT